MALSILSPYAENALFNTPGLSAGANVQAGQDAQKSVSVAGTDTVSLSGSAAESFAAGYGKSIGRVHGMRVSQAGTAPDANTSATFAADIMRRIGDLDENSSRNAENAQRLENSLARTLESVSAQYGKRTATAVMGAIYKSIGDGPVTEESLGQGFLNAIKLVDANFGFAEGDAFMADLNEDLNTSLNEFFDNGREETFYAVTPGEQLQFELWRAGQAAVKLGESMKDMVNAVAGLTDGLLTENDKKTMSEEIAEQLEEELLRKLESAQTEKTMQAYGAPFDAEAAGAHLNISV